MDIFSNDYFKMDHEVIREKVEIANKIVSSAKEGITKIKSYKAIKNKDEANKIKELLADTKKFVYAKRFNDIKDDTYGIIEVLRPVALGVFASVLFTPLVAIIAIVVDKVIKDKVSSDETKKLRDKLSKETELLRDDGSDEAIAKAVKLDKYIGKLSTYLDNINEEEDEEEDEELFGENFSSNIAYKAVVNNDEILQGISLKSSVNKLMPANECVLEYVIDVLNEGLGTKRAISKAANVDKKVSKALDRKFDRIIDYLKKSLIGATKEQVIRGSIPKLSAVLKIAMVSGAAVFIAPAIAILTAIIAFLIKKKLTDKEKKKIILELKSELEICEEKIKDADSNGEKDKKYQLMRLRTVLKKDIDRIKYGK